MTDRTNLPMILAAQGGDRAALGALLSMLEPKVYRFSYRLVQNEQDARDVTQDVLMRVVSNISRYDPKRSEITTWAFGITRNASVDEHRRRKRDPLADEFEVVLDGVASVAEQLDRARSDAKVSAAVGSLPPMYREALTEHYYEDLNHREMAERHEAPLGTMLNRVWRARQMVRSKLEAAA